MPEKYVKKYQNQEQGFGKVLVLYGGQSSEREVSLMSGERILKALASLGVSAVGLDPDGNVIEELKKHQPDMVFIALHGAGGEDGKMQALLEYLKVPYTGSGHAASALAMDKLRTKQVWQTQGLPTPEYRVVTADSNWQSVLNELGGEVFVKPDHEGSSIGMSCARNAEEFAKAFEVAAGYDDSVLVERRIVGAEYSVPLLGKKALAPIKLQAKNEFYDYEAKYLSDETEYLCPCGLSEEKELALRELCEQAYVAVGCEGWGRVDVMADEQGNFYLLEVNTVPGMTSHSLVPMAAKYEGMSFEELVAEILLQAQEKFGKGF